MMLIPVMGVDLYELTNNHLWRTEFSFSKFGEPPPPYMNVEQNQQGMTERGWLQFTLQNYYTLLNCGFRLRPTAGTATGVHPVPLGFGRVYVHLPKGFSYDGWIKGLDQGRSFVTTGPMLTVSVDGHPPGAVIAQKSKAPLEYAIVGHAYSAAPLEKIELVAAGHVARRITPENRPRKTGGYETAINTTWRAHGSTWLAIRCFEENTLGRVRFAHTAPVHIDVKGAALEPRRVEVEYLILRVEEQLQRSQNVLSPQALAEYREAVDVYRRLLKTK